MKILMIVGHSRSVVWFRQELIKFLQEKNNVVEVVACDDQKRESIEKLGVKLTVIGGDNTDIGIVSNLKYVIKLRKYVRKCNPDKILTFQAKANAFGVIACKLAGQKDISAMVEGLGSAFNQKGLKGKIIKTITIVLDKIAFRRLPTVFLLNTESVEILKKYKVIKDEQVELLNGIGVDLTKFAYTPIERTGTIKFCMIARQLADKGVREYCEAAKIIHNLGYNVEFHYYGDEDNATDILEQYGKDGYVINHGGGHYMPDVLKSIDVAVLPSSYHEGAPRSLMEASSVGRAIIASDVAGCQVVCKDGYNGLIVKRKDVDDLVDKIKKLIDNPSLIIEYGNNGRKYAEENFDSDIINQQIWERINK